MAGFVNKQFFLGLGIAFALAGCLQSETGDSGSPINTQSGPGTEGTPTNPEAIVQYGNRSVNRSASTAASRDPYVWPFSVDSIWNMPIGSSVEYGPAELEAAGHVGIAAQHILRLEETDPMRDVLGGNGHGDQACNGSLALGYALPLPDAWFAPDQRLSIAPGLMRNGAGAFLMPDGDTLVQLEEILRCEPGGPVFAAEHTRFFENQGRISIRGNGIDGVRGHGPSQMSAVGGTIRLGELTGKSELLHAIKINPWARKYLHYSEEVPGYRWPAQGAANYADHPARGYRPESFGRSSNPELVLGSLLAIPSDIGVADIPLNTEPAKILFQAMQDYGVYFVEDSGWDSWDLVVEHGVADELNTHYGIKVRAFEGPWFEDLNTLIRLLQVVTNNGPYSVGGGGIPRRPMAPPIS